MAEIVTLTMNPAIDVTTSVPRMVPAEKLRCDAVRRDPGGGGINVARAAARLGADVTAIYPVGGHGGRLLSRLVEEENIDTVTVPVNGETRHDFTVVDRLTNQQYRFVLPGAPLLEPEWKACLAAVTAAAAGSGIVCASGSLPPGVPEDFYARVARVVARWGGRLAVDTSGPALRSAVTEPIYLVKPSLRELRELVNAPLEEAVDMVAACRGLIKQRGVEVVALTLGARGALLVTANSAWRAPPLPLAPNSTVGAGDSFLGGLLWALASKMSLKDSFRHAVAAGSAALLASGTGLCAAPDVRRLLPQVTITDERATSPELA